MSKSENPYYRHRFAPDWNLDEVFLTVKGKRQYLWRVVAQDGDVIDILMQSCGNRRAALRFFRKLQPFDFDEWLSLT